MTTEQAKVVYVCIVAFVGMGVTFWMGLMMGRMGADMDRLERTRKKRRTEK